MPYGCIHLLLAHSHAYGGQKLDTVSLTHQIITIFPPARLCLSLNLDLTTRLTDWLARPQNPCLCFLIAGMQAHNTLSFSVCAGNLNSGPRAYNKHFTYLADSPVSWVNFPCYLFSALKLTPLRRAACSQSVLSNFYFLLLVLKIKPMAWATTHALTPLTPTASLRAAGLYTFANLIKGKVTPRVSSLK